MNCKPGDLAVFIHPINYGKVVTVTKLHPVAHPKHGPCWYYEGETLRENGDRLVALADCWLRPIRDPGDDAVDESKAWLPPVPTTTPTKEVCHG